MVQEKDIKDKQTNLKSHKNLSKQNNKEKTSCCITFSTLSLLQVELEMQLNKEEEEEALYSVQTFQQNLHE